MIRQISKFLFLTLVIAFTVQGCSKVKYGSNNGEYLTIRGTKIYYEEYGKGIPVLLIPGGFGSISDFQKIAPLLADNYRVIIIDPPGQGRSDHADKPVSYQLMSDYYSEIIDLLKLDSVYVIGHSDGGVAAFLLAKNNPGKVKKVISSGANYRADGVKNEVREFNETKLCNVDWAEVNNKPWIDKYKNLSPQNDWKKYVTETLKIWNEEEYFPKSDFEMINIPVLLIYGENDVIIPEHANEIQNSIKGSKLKILPKTSHNVYLEQPELMNTISNEFFDSK